MNIDSECRLQKLCLSQPGRNENIFFVGKWIENIVETAMHINNDKFRIVPDIKFCKTNYI